MNVILLLLTLVMIIQTIVLSRLNKSVMSLEKQFDLAKEDLVIREATKQIKEAKKRLPSEPKP